MRTTQEHRLETIGERLRRIKIKKILCLGTRCFDTKLEMTVERILSKMSDSQIEKMFNESVDVQYILLDSW